MESRKFVLKIDKGILYLIFLTIPFMEVSYIKRFTLFHWIFLGWQLVAFLIILISFLRSERKPSPVVYIIVIIQSYLITNTLIQGGEVRTIIRDSFYIIAVVLLYDLFASDELFVKSQLICFETLIYINLITIILYPDGLYQARNEVTTQFIWDASKNWFLGFYNTYTQFFIPGLTFSFIYAYQTKRKARLIALLCAVTASLLLVKSGGNLVSIFIMVLSFVFLKNFTRFFNYLNYWLVQIVFYVGIIVYKLQDIFDWLVNGVLHKQNSLDDRIILWGRIIQSVRERIVYGYGYENSNYRVIKYGVGAWARYAHNSLLEMMYQGGLIYLFLFH